MAKKIIVGTLAILILVISGFSCSSAKEVEQRKNLMMPKKSEMMRNERYKEPAKRRTNKTAKHHNSKSKKHF
jgi:hypothetical protein